MSERVRHCLRCQGLHSQRYAGHTPRLQWKVGPMLHEDSTPLVAWGLVRKFMLADPATRAIYAKKCAFAPHCTTEEDGAPLPETGPVK